MDIRKLIRDVPDFPKPGIIFKDITPLLGDPAGLRETVKRMAEPFRGMGVEVVAGAESRGFIVGVGLALELGAGFAPIRKPRKLPYKTISETYTLEYGTDTLCMHEDAIRPGQKVLMADDLLATGGTMAACCRMVERMKGEIVAVSFIVELSFLNGRRLLEGYDVRSLIAYDAE
ncbi:MAG TPA: adenine phosphoribosyltransferase [Candidatus Brocadiia bacterium]|nr:adenine phosphoribosyltransferase [Candidatus Brocadiia bacterium]